MAWGINPAVDQPDVNRVRRGLQREDLFTVVIEHFLTDTARFADLILPSTTQLEHFDVLGAWGHHYISVNNPAIEPVGESKSHGEIMRLLAPRLGLNGSAFCETDEEIAEATLPSGLEMAALKSLGWWKSSPLPHDFSRRHEGLRLVSEILPPQVPPEGMLQLLTPKAHYFMNSTFANMPRQRKSMRCPTLDMHPDDAESRGLVDDQQVVLRNERGFVRSKLRVVDTIHSGVVAMPGKWWSHPEETGAVGNVLTPSEWSPGGQPAYNDTFVEVSSE
jgi:anaerobic selenocysteine-containing dehydrogenase